MVSAGNRFSPRPATVVVMVGDENLRIGDAERDEAITLLREHMSAGRITAEEFDERMSSALTAKTKRELTVLFNDLPVSKSGSLFGASDSPASPYPIAQPPSAKHPSWLKPAMWIAGILVLLAFARYWGGILVPLIVLYFIFNRGSRNSSPQIVQQLSRPLQPPERDELVALIRQDRKIHAIKRYREMTGADLRTAKNAIDALHDELGR